MMDFDAALLVGGRSKRMGQDKALMDWHGQALWMVQVQKLLSLGSRRVYLASRSEQEFDDRIRSHFSPKETASLRVLEDPLDEACGPMGPISRCLKESKRPLLILAVDLPLMTIDFLRHRVVQAATPRKGLFFTGAHGPEVLGALYIPEMLPRIDDAIQSGNYSLQALVRTLEKEQLCDVRDLAAEEVHLWANANTPEEAALIYRFQP